MESEYINVISQFGFPIALSIYLLLTRDKTISQNTAILAEVKTAISQNTDTIKNLCSKVEKEK